MPRFVGRRWFYPALFLGLSLIAYFRTKSPDSPRRGIGGDAPESIYDITAKGSGGEDVSLASYRGSPHCKRCFEMYFVGDLLSRLNDQEIAALSGFTDSHYKEMNVLYGKYKKQGFEILAFPCNQFGFQEPGSNQEIREFACSKYKAEFPIFEKVDVNGENATTLYKFLKAQRGGIFGDSIKWNFTKFLVDKNGNVVQRYAPTTSPLQMEEEIKKFLGIS